MGWLLICIGVLVLGAVTVVYIWTGYQQMVDVWLGDYDDNEPAE